MRLVISRLVSLGSAVRLFCLTSSVLLTSCALSQSPSLVQPESWYGYSKADGRVEQADDLFRFSGSMIRLSGTSPGYLMSLETYQDFELTLQFRWNLEADAIGIQPVKNSGVMYRVPDQPDGLWPSGIQFQVKDGNSGDAILLGGVALSVKGQAIVPGKSVVTPRFVGTEQPPGQWNDVRIVAQGGHIQQYLNGELVNEGTRASVLGGHILLQYEGFPVDYQRIQLKQM